MAPTFISHSTEPSGRMIARRRVESSPPSTRRGGPVCSATAGLVNQTAFRATRIERANRKLLMGSSYLAGSIDKSAFCMAAPPASPHLPNPSIFHRAPHVHYGSPHVTAPPLAHQACIHLLPLLKYWPVPTPVLSQSSQRELQLDFGEQQRTASPPQARRGQALPATPTAPASRNKPPPSRSSVNQPAF
jgi:hypothetical protein